MPRKMASGDGGNLPSDGQASVLVTYQARCVWNSSCWERSVGTPGKPFPRDESPFFLSCHFVGSGVYLTPRASPFFQQRMACLVHRTAILQAWLLETVPLNWAWWRVLQYWQLGGYGRRIAWILKFKTSLSNIIWSHFGRKKIRSGERVSTQTLTSKLPSKVEFLDPVIWEQSSQYSGFGSKLSVFFFYRYQLGKWEAVRNRAIFSFHFYVLERELSALGAWCEYESQVWIPAPI